MPVIWAKAAPSVGALPCFFDRYIQFYFQEDDNDSQIRGPFTVSVAAHELVKPDSNTQVKAYLPRLTCVQF